MKVFSLKTLIIVDCFVLILLTISYFKFGINPKPISQASSLVDSQTVKPKTPGIPVQLIIPAINVDTNIHPLGVTSKGEMEAPESIVDVAWFKLGSLPGEIGSAVIAGHFNGKKNEAGVFFNLDKLKKDDEIIIKDDKGQSLTFIVQQIRLYNPGYAENIFSSNDKAHLNLITCDGVWDKNKESYSKRLVVLADISE